jgi:acetate kinase
VIKRVDLPAMIAHRTPAGGGSATPTKTATMRNRRVLTLNTGSSSLKFSVYETRGETATALLTGKLERIGACQSHFEAIDNKGTKLAGHLVSVSDHDGAISLLLDRLPSLGAGSIEAVGHRIVQGGEHPPHLPAALKAIESAERLGDDIPQVACFDTAFHRTMPEVAQQLPLPRELTHKTGLLRYGFHGLSYEFIMGELKMADPKMARGKVIIAHLGNGASMAAVHNGKSVDTTMGFTPAGGLMMGSRTGDLDPGVIDYLLREKKITPENLNSLIYQRSGLKGVSGISSDMRDLLENSDPNARRAVDLFVYQARKCLGALVGALDGVETIVFTGGIGENAAAPRAAICAGFAHLGLEIDARRNTQHRDVISTYGSKICVRVMPTNEEVVIARHTSRLAFA